jgi:imidazolonepropionase-like amidohydrolase
MAQGVEPVGYHATPDPSSFPCPVPDMTLPLFTAEAPLAPPSSTLLFIVLAFCLVILPPQEIHGQAESAPAPAVWAIPDVDVVHGNGEVEEGVTLIVRQGRVEGMGQGIPVPPGARVVEWKEGTLQIYPGLVDGHGGLPLDLPRAELEGLHPWSGTREAQNMTPGRRAADYLDVRGEDLTQHRRAGVVASAVFPGRGPMPGQPALVLHRAEARSPGELVLNSTLGVALSFQGSRGFFPSTLMGTHALLRQAFLDAQHYRDHLVASGNGANGSKAMGEDRDLQALLDATEGDRTVFFQASGLEGVRRALRLSDELGFAPVIVGGEGAGRLGPELARRGVPVLLGADLDPPVHWDPEEEQLDARAARERDRLLPIYETAAQFEAAGVEFAITSGGGEEEDLLVGARLYVEYGLTLERALQAMTLTPAQVLGAPGLGRVEEGGAATFVVTDGDLLAEGTQVVWTFVDGVAERGSEPFGRGDAQDEEEPAIDEDQVVPPGPPGQEAENGSGDAAGDADSENSAHAQVGGDPAARMDGGSLPGVAASGELDPPYPTGDLFIQELDAVWTVTGQVLEGASILIRDGVIQALGTDLELPGDEIPVLDGRGRTAIPGIVDEHSHTAQQGGANEGTAPVVPEIRVEDALDPSNFGIFRALQGGVTTARIMHGSSNPIGGQSAVVKMRWGMEAGSQLLIPDAPRAVKFALGENVTRKAAQARMPPVRFPASRSGVESLYDQAFTAAARYRELWAAYESDPVSFPARPRRDLRLEALVEIMENRIRVHAHSYRSDEILMLMRVAERHGFTIDNFTHVLEGYRIADELREHGAGASTFSDWWQFKLEAYDAIPYNASLMAERGVLTALNSDIPWLQPFMKWEVAKPVQYGGASKEDALRMLTLNPATMMGVDDRVGSLEVGKEGDVVLLTGDPFDAFSRVETTVVDGIIYYDSEREAELRGEMVREISQPSRDRGHSAREPGIEQSGGPGEWREMREGGWMDALGGAQDPVALTRATIHPVSGPPIEDGVLILEGGRIQAVGTRDRVEIPEWVREVELPGRHLYPGMFDPLTHLGLFEIGSISQATDRREIGDFNPHIRALPSYQPHGRAVAVARARGITSVLTSQSGGIIQGMGSVVDLLGDTFERAEIRGAGALMVDLPVPESTAANSEDREPSLSAGDLPELIEFLERAREFAESGQVALQGDEPFEVNLQADDAVVLEAMLPVLKGAVPVFFRADSEWQIRHLLLLLQEFPELKGVLVGGGEAARLAPELAQAQLPVILTRTRRPTADRDDPVTGAMTAAAVLHEAGIQVAFGTDDSADVRNLPEHVAIAVSHGLPASAGLEAVTLNPARILGLEGELGTLEVGARGDILVTDGDPLQPLTGIEALFIGGHPVDPRDNHHTRMYESFRERR